MPPRDLGYVRTALLVNFHRNESPTPPSTPIEWIEVPDPNAPKTFWEKFLDNCKCECMGDRNNETPGCRIS